MILTIAGHVEIDPTIVIIVASGDAHAEAFTFHPSTFSYVFKCAISFLMIESVPESGIGLVGQGALRHRVFQQCAVGKEDIHPPIVVVIKDRHAAAHRLQKVLDRSRRSRMFEIDFRERGDVGERHG